MDSSSHIRPKKPLLVIGNMTNYGSTHPKPSGYSSSSGLNRDSRYNYDDRRNNNLPLKKARTMVDSDNGNKTVVGEPDTSKLSRQFWKAEDEEPVPRYCRSDHAEVRDHPQFLHANATGHKWALGALAELVDNSLDEDVTQSRAVDRIRDMGLENGKHGHGISETVSVDEASELQKVKEESAKHLAKLQRQKGQLESQLKESKRKIQDFEKTHKLKDDSEKLVAELINQLKQSTSKIKDLEKMQNVKDDESAKQMAELHRQKALLEIESEKIKQSEAKNQDLEYKLKNAEDEFFQKRAHRDSTEHDLRNKLREAFATIHTLTSKVKVWKQKKN